MPIARIWRGATRAADARRYLEYLEGTGIAEYLATPGNRGVEVLCRERDGRAYFTLRTLWDTLDDVRAFAGDDVEVARFYPEDDAFLVERELTVEHHDVLADRRHAHASVTVDHVKLRVADVAASAAFYTAALAPLGIVPLARHEDGSTGFGRDGSDDFWIEPGGGGRATAHVAFAAPTRDAVDAFHAAALAQGGTDNGAPGLRPEYHDHYYAAYVIDPDGTNAEAVCHIPSARTSGE